MVLAAFVSGTVIWKIEENRLEKRRAAVVEIANENSAQLQRNIDHALALTYPLGAMLQHDGKIDKFASMGEKLIESYPFISEIALAPKGVIKEVVPFSGNEKALGLDLLAHPEQKTEAVLARKTGKLTLAGPLQLVQGGEGLVGRLPVFRGERKSFWGFVLIAIRFPEILDTTALGKLKKEGYQYTLTRIHPKTKVEEIIVSSANGLLDRPVETGITVPNAQWTLRIAPINGWYDLWSLTIEIAAGLLISLLLGYTAKQFFELRNYRYSLEKLVDKRTAEISETKNQLHTLLDTIPDLIWLKDREGAYLLCNPMFERFFGAKEAEIVGKSDYDFVDKELADFFREKDRQAMQNGGPSINEEWLTFADGGHRSLHETIKTPVYDEAGILVGILGIARDITERHNNEIEIRHLAKMYASLSQCNQAIIHSATPQELFEKICESAVKQGGMAMAWIALIDSGTGLLFPAASYGDDEHYLEGLAISAEADDPSGRGPTGIAIREERPYWCTDFLNDPATEPWHERGELMGWKASAALPIHQNGDVIGAFMLYSKLPNAFDAMSRELIIEMTTDISFAMDVFDREAKRKASENDLIQTERLLEEMSSMAHIGGWDFDAKNGTGTWTKEVARIHDLDPKAQPSIEKGLSFYAEEWLEKIEFALDEAINKGVPYDLELKMTTAKGKEKWVRTIGVPIVENGETIRVRGSLQDITAQKMAEERVHWLAHFDHLTGLPNRTLLTERVENAIHASNRTQNPVALLYLDLDHFKNINDSLGHNIGDELLIEVASRMQSVLREEDTLSRQGGDEFVIVLPDTDANGATHVAKKLIETVSQAYSIQYHELTVTPSIGIALYPIDGVDFNALYQAADAAMYRAKDGGRNRYSFFTAEIQARSVRTLELENALRNALSRNELELYYQPQISIDTQRIVGAEALLRWKHPTFGTVSPAEFIPVAEDSGQILAIGEWVLRSAIMQLKSWIESGMKPFVMAVNLSAIQFRDPKLVSQVLAILEELQLPAEYLELELTEGTTMEDPLHAIELMNELHDHGIRMSIDDFGTGYSSLNYLKRFQVYKLKIDQSFIRDITEDPDDRSIVNAIIKMANSLNMQTIAEGVESVEQLAFLHESGCNEVQGYYFSRPLPSEAFAQFVNEHL
jgi:diguanylate cyclase (GGDEF)-like protein/PAS domain S-box-containing protein